LLTYPRTNVRQNKVEMAKKVVVVIKRQMRKPRFLHFV